MDDYTLLESLFGAKRAEGGTAHMETATMTGVAVEDSDGGQVRIIPDGHVAAAEGEDNTIVIPTSPNVEAGDTVLVSMTGGVSKSPMVIGAKGAGDRVKADIDDFKEYADVTYTHETEFDEVTGALSRSITATYSATAPNLSPFYSHDLSDVYNVTTNPDGYWSTAAANTELTGDGWAHIVMDNSGASGYMYRYASVRASHIPIVAGTFVVEVKNLVKTGIGRFGMGSTAQALTFDAKDITENGTYYIPVQINDGSAAVGLDARWFAAGGVSAEFDARLSYYEGAYEGNYKSYRPTDIDVSQEYTSIHTFEESVDEINSTFADYYTKEDIDGNGTTTGLARRSELTQAVDGITASVAQNYTTKTEFADGVYASTAPNLTPFFGHGRPASGTADDYWSHLAATYTILDDGWGHYANDRSEASSTVYPQFSTNTQPFIEEGAAYTLLVELRNVSVVGGEGLVALRPHLAGTSTQLPGSNSGANSINLRNVEGSGTFYIPCVAADDFTDKTRMLYSNVHHTAGANVSFDIRVSLYEGDYKGTYKPYVDTTLGREIASIKTDYATKAELSVQEGSVGILAQGILTKSAEYTDNTIDTEILGETGAINVTKNAIEQEVSRVYSTKYEAADGNLIEQRGLVDGYIRTDGTISASDTAKEWTTALIGVTPGQVLSLTTTLDETPTSTWRAWIAYCFYDSNQAKVGSRTSKYGTENVDLELSYPSITVPSGAAYIRCSWRYYNVPSHAVLVPNIDATYASKSSLSLTNDAITAIVSKSATYVDPTTGQTLTNGLSTTVTQTASDVSTLITDVDGLQTMIRETSDGILVAKSGNAVGALVNADGSFDVVELTWSGDTPTIGISVGSFAQDDVHIGSQVGYQSQSAISEAEIHLCEEGLIHYTMEDGSGGTTISMELAASDSAGYVSNQIVLRPTTDASDYCYLRLVSLPYSAGTNSSATLKAEEVTLYDVDGSASQTVSMADLKKLIRNTTVTVNQSYTGNGAHFETDTSTSASSITGDVCGKNVCFPVKLVLTSNYQFSHTKIAQIADASCYPSQTAQIPVFCISANWSSPSTGWMYINTSGEVMLWTAGAVGIVFTQVNYMTA